MRFGSRVPGLAPIYRVLRVPYAAHHLSKQEPEKLPCHSPTALRTIRAACSCPNMVGQREHRPVLTWTKELADPSRTCPSRVWLDRTAAALLLGSCDILFNGWLLKTLHVMKGGPVYPKREEGHMTFNEVIMNHEVIMAILPILRNPSLSISFHSIFLFSWKIQLQ